MKKNRKFVIKNHEVYEFMIKGQRCVCGCNVFHEEFDDKMIYVVCNACKRDNFEMDRN